MTLFHLTFCVSVFFAVNGGEQQIGIKNQSPTEILRVCHQLRTRVGRPVAQMTRWQRGNKKVHKSIQGKRFALDAAAVAQHI
jgi:hypothetical protein